MFAVFHLCGTLEVARDFFIMDLSGAASSSLHLCSSIGGKLSGPGALFSLVSFTALRTSVIVMSI